MSPIQHKGSKPAQPREKPITPAAHVASARDGLDDSIAQNRGVEYTRAEDVHAVPTGFRPTRPEVRRQRLQRVPEALHAEMTEALMEYASAGARVAADLGDLAPDATTAQPLAERIAGLTRSIQVQEVALAAHRELEDIALSDGHKVLERAFKHYSVRVEELPHLAQRYPKLAKFFAMRSQAITDGIAAAKQVGTLVDEARAEGVRQSATSATGDSGEATESSSAPAATSRTASSKTKTK